MSKLENETGVYALIDWASEKLQRPVVEADIKKDKLGFYIEAPLKEYVPNNLQEICLLLNK